MSLGLRWTRSTLVYGNGRPFLVPSPQVATLPSTLEETSCEARWKLERRRVKNRKLERFAFVMSSNVIESWHWAVDPDAIDGGSHRLKLSQTR
ncbi:hypothetical protein CC1G_15080 [Coprinopsis cinerea okayama7|uniref:Uncharacterized protein n=1 Tax=Coprinopsis cinerea (strain Okayama-7 / 130 / ATCC MYA-4618 / FGSC 9003) TaxID=240176 RepID=D6RPE7_COPC7|nr:hypothetical protein CC1G_15080 [Coprinopsis cinerea okayama7\|eukprot:XP_002910746.1 hypothetical protein CC1G_15080 [Coprinopsis cinerea okayama7\